MATVAGKKNELVCLQFLIRQGELICHQSLKMASLLQIFVEVVIKKLQVVEDEICSSDGRKPGGKQLEDAWLYLRNIVQVRTQVSRKMFWFHGFGAVGFCVSLDFAFWFVFFIIFRPPSTTLYTFLKLDSETCHSLKLVMKIFERVHKTFISALWVLKNNANLLAKHIILLMSWRIPLYTWNVGKPSTIP